MERYKKLITYTGSGILLGIGFLFPVFWLVGILGATFLIQALLKETNFKKALLWGGFTWFTKFLFVLGFYWSLYPIKWLPFDFGYGEFGIIALYWISVAFFLGIGGAVFSSLLHLLKCLSLHKKLISYLSIPLIWVVSEIGGSFMLSVFTIGPGSELNAYFSLGYIGLLFAEHPVLLQFARIAGVYSLSFIAIVLAVWLVNQNITSSVKKNIYIVGLLLILWSSSFGYDLPSAPYSTLQPVALVSTSFPVQELFNRDSLPELEVMQQEVLTAALSTQANYIIFPEDARIFDQTENIEKEKALFNFTHTTAESVIVDSGRVSINGAGVLQGLLFDTKSNQHSTVHKRYLVPQGEFVPFIYEWVFRALGFNELMDSVTDLVSYRIGPNTSQSQLPSMYPGLLFCFESASATGVKSLLNERPGLPFVAHPVSHSWFNSPESFWSQLDSALKVQAVWNQVAIASAGNHAPSKLFLPNGEIVLPEEVAYGEYWSVGIINVPIR